jgi:DNA-binding response OmpR family regulator
MARTILVVEDDPSLSLVLKITLQAYGFDVQCAHTGAQALTLIEQSCPTLIMLDVTLPDMDAFQIVQRLRGDIRFATLPLIIHTSHDLSHEQEMQLKLGPTRYVTKTFAGGVDFPQFIDKLLADQISRDERLEKAGG